METPVVETSKPVSQGDLAIQEKPLNKAILIALSTLFGLGMLFSYAFGGSWLLILSFFALTLSPLFSLGRVVDVQRGRILAPQDKI